MQCAVLAAGFMLRGGRPPQPRQTFVVCLSLDPEAGKLLPIKIIRRWQFSAVTNARLIEVI